MRSSIVLLLALSAFADETKVSGERALETVKVLASDDFGGRKSGLASGKQAEDWMAKQVEALGLKPGYRGSYVHAFKASVTEDGQGAEFAASGGGIAPRKGTYLTDFVTLIYSGKGTVEREVVFVGYGIHAPDRGHDDYKDLDVDGKIVMAMRGVPPNSGMEEERFIGYKSSNARDRGAVGFLLVQGDKAVPGTIQEKYHRGDLPAVWLSRAAADDLFSRAKKPNLKAQEEALKKGARGFVLDGVKVKLSISARLLKDQPMRNVVAAWPGKTDEWVVLGAHLDHVGTDGIGNVYNGADDNASGSAMLLEVARAIAKTGKRFERGLLFVWFAAEEQGLTGSRRFVKEPPLPLDRIAVMINTDMVGQGKPVMAFGGAEVYPTEAAWLALEGFDIKPFRSQPNSDHFPFQNAGVPAFFVHTQGPHPNYHQPGDDWQNIQPALLEQAGRYVRALAEKAATLDQLFCRPGRLAGYVWHNARVVSLDGPGDFTVRWFDGDLDEAFNAIADDPDAHRYTPGANIDSLANDLKPAVIRGLRGPAARRAWKPARKLGVTIVEPFPMEGELPDYEGVVVSLRGAPADPALAAIKAPILVPEALAEKLPLQQRKGPWLVMLDSADPAKMRRWGVTRVWLPKSDPAAVQAMLDEKLARTQIRALLGGNVLALLRKN